MRNWTLQAMLCAGAQSLNWTPALLKIKSNKKTERIHLHEINSRYFLFSLFLKRQLLWIFLIFENIFNSLGSRIPGKVVHLSTADFYSSRPAC
jgi:hypothetical protein